MNNRFRRELYDFLIQDEISLETSIVNDLIYQMAGIEFDKSNETSYSYSGFNLRESYDKSDKIRFTLPNLKMPQLLKLMQFFKVPAEEYQVNSPLKLDGNVILNELLPAFKAYYNSFKVNQPEELKKYYLESKSILESSAISTLTSYTNKVIDKILNDDQANISDNLKTVVDTLLLLNKKVEDLRSYPILYKSIIESAQNVTRLLQFTEIQKNTELVKQLTLVLEGIMLFARYNRTESVLANKSFLKEMETFLNQEKISYTQCDVIQKTFLRLCNLGIDLNTITASKYVGNDASRLVFQVANMNKETAQKIVSYLQNEGDETAIFGYGYGKYGSAIPERAAKSGSYPPPPGTGNEPVEQYGIETDGKFFYEHIFQKLKDEIIAMKTSAPEILESYREKSRCYLEKCAKEKPSSELASVSLFKFSADPQVRKEQLSSMYSPH